MGLALSSLTTAAQEPLFRLMDGKATGIQFVNQISETEGLNVLAYEYFFNGGGLAVGDLNNDGLQDLVFTANMKPNKIYLNTGNLSFKDITKTIGSGIEGRTGDWKTGVTLADVNNDGLLDIYICYSGKVEPYRRRNELFINQGNLRFKEMAAQVGLADSSYSNQAAFFDYDRDGDADMFLLNHSIRKVDNLEFAKYRSLPDAFAGCKLYQNEKGYFREVTQKAGISQSALTFGLGVVVADINLDGWPDLYVTNDYNEPDHLYLNNQNGTFTDAADAALSHMSQFSMGADIADFNNDGLPDIITLDMLPEDNRRQKLLQLQENYEIFELMQQQGLHRQYMRNMLHLNNGNGTFSEIGQLAGIFKTDWSWTPIFADLDNDGWKDLFISNGYLRDYTNKDFLKYWGDYKVKKAIEREPVQLMDLIQAMPVTKLPNYVFRNTGNLRFEQKQQEWGITHKAISSAAIAADLDNDGDLELVISNINEPASVYRNMSRENGGTHFMTLDIRNASGSPANGARATLYSGNTRQYLEQGQCRGYLSSASTLLHFGLGREKQADSLRIVWPDGNALTLTRPAADTTLVIRYPNNTSVVRRLPESAPAVTAPMFRTVTPPVSYRHSSFGENDFKRQPLMLFMYSNTGPVMANGDINNDGLEDLFISGNKTQPGALHVQQKDGSFKPVTGLSLVNEEEAAVAAAVFFDANGDGFQDLYLAKGGYSVWEPNTSALQDELYLNNGKGSLVASPAALPNVSASSKSCVRPADADNDGDLDLFVGGRIIPGRYPVSPESYLLLNDGKGRFTKQTVPFSYIGMVTDAQWHDINADGRKDLFICGEMMPLMVYLNLPDGFEDATDRYFDRSFSGCWNTLLLKDLNGDSRPEIVAGNLGLNAPFTVSEQQPATLYYADFDQNGSIDPFFNFYIRDTAWPYVSRDELNEQIYAMRKKFTSYELYATAMMDRIFSIDDLNKANVLTANVQETMVFSQNSSGKFVPGVPLPVQAQFSYVKQIISDDFTGDGKPDLLLLGNQSANRLKMGAITANYGCLLAGKGDGSFEYVGQPLSGLQIKGDVKSAVLLHISGQKIFIAGATDQPLQAYAY